MNHMCNFKKHNIMSVYKAPLTSKFGFHILSPCIRCVAHLHPSVSVRTLLFITHLHPSVSVRTLLFITHLHPSVSVRTLLFITHLHPSVSVRTLLCHRIHWAALSFLVLQCRWLYLSALVHQSEAAKKRFLFLSKLERFYMIEYSNTHAFANFIKATHFPYGCKDQIYLYFKGWTKIEDKWNVTYSDDSLIRAPIVRKSR